MERIDTPFEGEIFEKEQEIEIEKLRALLMLEDRLRKRELLEKEKLDASLEISRHLKQISLHLESIQNKNDHQIFNR